MAELKNLIKKLGKYSLSMTETGKKIINYILQSWTDDTVVSWLKTLPNQVAFLNLLRYFTEWLSNLPEQLKKKKKKKKKGGHVDIVIVAHGEITDTFMPAGLLVPAPTIVDTVLYSPWNCLIDAYAACAIAEGWDTTDGRCFENQNKNQPVQFEPSPLPNHWNHMRWSFCWVPCILLTPVCPKEKVWAEFQRLRGHVDRVGRVIIPYIIPEVCVTETENMSFIKVFGKMPFVLFIIALSYILMLNETTATVHLAACLGGGESESMPAHWLRQYAYTNDQTFMSTRKRHFSNDRLFRALRAMFDRNGR